MSTVTSKKEDRNTARSAQGKEDLLKQAAMAINRPIKPSAKPAEDTSNDEQSKKEVSLFAPLRPMKRSLIDLKNLNDSAPPPGQDEAQQEGAVDMSNRVILKARRRYNPTSHVVEANSGGETNKLEPVVTGEDLPEAGRGKFTLSGGLDSLSLNGNSAQKNPTFHFQAPFQASSTTSKKQSLLNLNRVGAEVGRTKINNLSKEKKLFVNRNLFANPMVKPMPQQKSAEKQNSKIRSSQDQKEPDQEEKNTIAKDANSLVQLNPLSSAEALKQQKDLSKLNGDGTVDTHESPVIKSLFDFKGNSKFKGDSLDERQKKKSFEFTKNRDSENRGLILTSSKKQLPESGQTNIQPPSNPFSKPGQLITNPFASASDGSAKQTNPFASAAAPKNGSMFGDQSSGLFSNPFASTKQVPPPWLKKDSAKNPDTVQAEDAQSANSSPVTAPEKKEELKSSGNTKYFQSQIEKIKVLKGFGNLCPEPCTKGNGYLSIEEANKVLYVVFRTFTGATLFSGILSPTSAKSKVLDEDPKKFKVKFTTVVLNKERAAKVEHCEAKFLNAVDRDNFMNVYQAKSKPASDS